MVKYRGAKAFLFAMGLSSIFCDVNSAQVPATPQKAHPLSATEAVTRFAVPEDLEVDLILSEPLVQQPVSMSFDERGRLWIVQYLQYPFPAGLKMVSRDRYWRAVYDKVPPPPPDHFRGKDQITIHEDSDGDGIFDRHKIFLEGMNIVTSVARGRGGVWVLNPPYLLFYPDMNDDDVPDSDPEVHLSGFGLEDTHSVVNSLCWGPDGWLYAAQGSTVSGNVSRSGYEDAPVHSMGQLIWRYHPVNRIYEIFAEGGGNSFGVEIDSKGRIYSGHNGGNTRGFHYVQGGYYQKGFSKHGSLSNPFAFGYFEAMKHHDVQRFTHTFLIYEGSALPDRYHGRLFGVAPLLNHVVSSQIKPDGSSFQTTDIGFPMQTPDPWFRPVDIKHGPDGSIYVADWYDEQVNHYRNHEGRIDVARGRIYRLRSKETDAMSPFDLRQKTSHELVDLLENPNRWLRQTVLRVLADRRDPSVITRLQQGLRVRDGQFALEALWALNASGGFEPNMARELLTHEDPYVRAWTIRLIADQREILPDQIEQLVERARYEPERLVRSQLASSARRLTTPGALRIVKYLLLRPEDEDDIHIPLLLWWAIETKAETHREEILAWFEDPSLWAAPMIRHHILGRLVRRFAQKGSRQDLVTCAALFRMAPDSEYSEQLLAGLETAFQGRRLGRLPQPLIEVLANLENRSTVLGIRQGQGPAVEEALRVLEDEHTDLQLKQRYVEVFAEVQQPACVPVLLSIARHNMSLELRKSAIVSLQSYEDNRIGPVLVGLLSKTDQELRDRVLTTLVSRTDWVRQLLQTVNQTDTLVDLIPDDIVSRIRLHNDPSVSKLSENIWGPIRRASSEELQTRMDRLAKVILSGKGDPYAGKPRFVERCAKCHSLFGVGERVGPDLTSYQRSDLPNMLLAVVNPDAEIREGYENHLVVTDDGRTLTGILVDQDLQTIVIRGADGQVFTMSRESIDAMEVMKASMMPTGVLRDLTDVQIRDLFAYLRSSQPLND